MFCIRSTDGVFNINAVVLRKRRELTGSRRALVAELTVSRQALVAELTVRRQALVPIR